MKIKALIKSQVRIAARNLIASLLILAFLCTSIVSPAYARQGNYGDGNSFFQFITGAYSGAQGSSTQSWGDWGLGLATTAAVETADLWYYNNYYSDYGKALIRFNVGGTEVDISRGQMVRMVASVAAGAVAGIASGQYSQNGGIVQNVINDAQKQFIELLITETVRDVLVRKYGLNSALAGLISSLVGKFVSDNWYFVTWIMPEIGTFVSESMEQIFGKKEDKNEGVAPIVVYAKEDTESSSESSTGEEIPEGGEEAGVESSVFATELVKGTTMGAKEGLRAEQNVYNTEVKEKSDEEDDEEGDPDNQKGGVVEGTPPSNGEMPREQKETDTDNRGVLGFLAKWLGLAKKRGNVALHPEDAKEYSKEELDNAVKFMDKRIKRAENEKEDLNRQWWHLPKARERKNKELNQRIESLGVIRGVAAGLAKSIDDKQKSKQADAAKTMIPTGTKEYWPDEVAKSKGLQEVGISGESQNIEPTTSSYSTSQVNDSSEQLKQEEAGSYATTQAVEKSIEEGQEEKVNKPLDIGQAAALDSYIKASNRVDPVGEGIRKGVMAVALPLAKPAAKGINKLLRREEKPIKEEEKMRVKAPESNNIAIAQQIGFNYDANDPDRVTKLREAWINYAQEMAIKAGLPDKVTTEKEAQKIFNKYQVVKFVDQYGVITRTEVMTIEEAEKYTQPKPASEGGKTSSTKVPVTESPTITNKERVSGGTVYDEKVAEFYDPDDPNASEYLDQSEASNYGNTHKIEVLSDNLQSELAGKRVDATRYEDKAEDVNPTAEQILGETTDSYSEVSTLGESAQADPSIQNIPRNEDEIPTAANELWMKYE